jgi:hypothetical protein
MPINKEINKGFFIEGFGKYARSLDQAKLLEMMAKVLGV